MAFVNRSERNFNLNLNENNIGPGEYFLNNENEDKNNNFLKKIIKI